MWTELTWRERTITRLMSIPPHPTSPAMTTTSESSIAVGHQRLIFIFILRLSHVLLHRRWVSWVVVGLIAVVGIAIIRAIVVVVESSSPAIDEAEGVLVEGGHANGDFNCVLSQAS